MKFSYHAETDSLYIDLTDKLAVDSKEMAPGIVIDFDERGHAVGIDIDQASQFVNLQRLDVENLPVVAA